MAKKQEKNSTTPKKKGLGGAGCRRKGHSFERECAIALRKIFPTARRHLEYQDGQAFGVDLAETGEFLFQCKSGKRYAPLTAIGEIKICPIEGGIPVLITKGDRTEPLACLPFRSFLKLLKKRA